MTTPDPHIPERLQKLEEAQAFAEHTVEQLGEEVLAINRRLQSALARLERLEQRLGQVAAQVESPEPPVEGGGGEAA